MTKECSHPREKLVPFLYMANVTILFCHQCGQVVPPVERQTAVSTDSPQDQRQETNEVRRP